MDTDDPLTPGPGFPPPPPPPAVPPGDVPAPPPFLALDTPAPPRRKAGPWTIVTSAIAVLLAVAIIVGLNYHLDKRLERPGTATPLSAGVTITGAKSYRHSGSFLLLTVFVDDHPTILHYLKEKLFESDVSEEPLPPPSPVNEDQQNVCDMTDSQATAKSVALRKLGYKLTAKPGVLVATFAGTPPGEAAVPATHALTCGDLIQTVDGHAASTLDSLHSAIATHKPGDTVDVGFTRAGKLQHARVQLACAVGPANNSVVHAPGAAACAAKDATALVGIQPQLVYDYPFKINIDTGDVTGPSGGLAMTLTLLDLLSPCDLTGGQKIAVTGTIDDAGNVGGIGGTPKKVIAARHSGAKLFIVGANSDDMDAARAQAKGMKFVVVHTLDEALKALQQAGGQPLGCAHPG